MPGLPPRLHIGCPHNSASAPSHPRATVHLIPSQSPARFSTVPVQYRSDSVQCSPCSIVLPAVCVIKTVVFHLHASAVPLSSFYYNQFHLIGRDITPCHQEPDKPDQHFIRDKQSQTDQSDIEHRLQCLSDGTNTRRHIAIIKLLVFTCLCLSTTEPETYIVIEKSDHHRDHTNHCQYRLPDQRDHSAEIKHFAKHESNRQAENDCTDHDRIYRQYLPDRDSRYMAGRVQIIFHSIRVHQRQIQKSRINAVT